MAKAFRACPTAKYTEVTGAGTCNTARGCRSGLWVTLIEVISSMANLKVKGFTIGQMGTHTTASGRTAICKGSECTSTVTVRDTKDNSTGMRRMATE